MIIKPPRLTPGSKIGVCAPSSRINPERFAAGLSVLRDGGYDVFVHPQCQAEYGQMAGTDIQRAAALMDLLLDDAITAIFFAAGGHRAAELLPLLDWALLESVPPKILMGFSDSTVLLNAFTARLGWATMFGPVVQTIGRTRDDHPDTWKRSDHMLRGDAFTYDLDYTGPAIEGILCGGTLAMLPMLLDTRNMPDLNGAILMIEDVNEELSSIDRVMLHLRGKGVFDKAAAVICGAFTGMLDTGRPFGFSAEEIMRHHLRGTNCQLALNAPFGHGDSLYAWPLGVHARLHNNRLSLLEPGVS